MIKELIKGMKKRILCRRYRKNFLQYAKSKNELNKKDEKDFFYYSVDKAIELGYRVNDFIRPTKIVRNNTGGWIGDITRINRTFYCNKKTKLICNTIYVKELLENNSDVVNKVLDVYVDTQCGDLIVVRDDTGSVKIKLNKFLFIAGDFVLINFNRVEGKYFIKEIVINNN